MATKRRTIRLTSGFCALASILALGGVAGRGFAQSAPVANPAGWSAEAAARYLDQREVWWQSWDRTQKDRATLCISCHTQAPYALARPVLRGALGEKDQTPEEKKMLASITKRVQLWSGVQPFYSDLISGPGKEVESRNAEAVLNAIILSGYEQGADHLSPLALLAFDHAWALQTQTGPEAGGWVWQDFSYSPWEAKESAYHWAALMALAVGQAPGGYAKDPKIASSLALLTGYLRSHFASQNLVNRTTLLWASSSLPGLMTGPERAALISALKHAQQPDGGWNLAELGGYSRLDLTAEDARSDGYATGLVVLALERSPERSPERSDAEGAIKKGLAWLRANQNLQKGAWPAWSVNKSRDPNSEIGQFMSDAATGYAVLALATARP